MLASLLKFKLPFQSVGNGVIVKDGKIRSTIHDDQFWMDLKTLSTLLQPFSQLVTAMQAKGALLADVFGTHAASLDMCIVAKSMTLLCLMQILHLPWH